MYRDMTLEPWENFIEDTSDRPKIHNMIRRTDTDWSYFEKALKHYYAFMSSIDYEIGRLVEYLKAEGLYDDTVIIFSADHGDSQGAHNRLENKSCHFYEEISRIPLILKPAIKDYRGYTQSAFAGTCDFYGTILDIAGVSPLDNGRYNDGYSLMPFVDNSSVSDWRDSIVTENLNAFPVLVTQRMYRYQDIKYIFNGGGIDELYDLGADPYEKLNLVNDASKQTLLDDMKERLASYMEDYRDPIYNAFCKINEIREFTV